MEQTNPQNDIDMQMVKIKHNQLKLITIEKNQLKLRVEKYLKEEVRLNSFFRKSCEIFERRGPIGI